MNVVAAGGSLYGVDGLDLEARVAGLTFVEGGDRREIMEVEGKGGAGRGVVSSTVDKVASVRDLNGGVRGRADSLEEGRVETKPALKEIVEDGRLAGVFA